MQLYVPEIGDEIRLTNDWTFELHAEYRNEQLAALFGYYIQMSLLVNESIVPKIRPVDYKIDYPDLKDPRFRKHFGEIDHNAYYKECDEARNSCPEYVKYQADSTEWYANIKKHGTPTVSVTLPAGTLLKIDRIYIRKGSSDFSSITFYAKGLGEVMVSSNRWTVNSLKTTKRKAQRFWAKLADCNQIQFERVE